MINNKGHVVSEVGDTQVIVCIAREPTSTVLGAAASIHCKGGVTMAEWLQL